MDNRVNWNNNYGTPSGYPQGNPYGQPVQGTQGNPYGQPAQGTQGNPYGQPARGTQGNPYGQPAQGTQGNPYRQPVQGMQQKPDRQGTKKKDTKKKKGKGWLIVLIVIAAILLLIFGIRGIGKLLENRLRNDLPGIPFTFAEGDDIGYVTADFLAETDSQAGKTDAIRWSSSDETLITVGEDGSCAVTRPKERNEAVTMTASARYLLVLTAKADYEVTVVRTDRLTPEEVYVPDRETIERGTGRYAFTVHYDDSGKPFWISGKLGTRVESIEDAQAAAESYRPFFEIPEGISLQFMDMSTTAERIFTFAEYYEDARLDGYTVSVTADENGVLTGVTANLPEVLMPGGGRPLSEEEQDAVLEDRYEEFFCLDREYVFWEGSYTWQIRCWADGDLLQIEMDAFSGRILAEEPLLLDAWPEAELSGTDSLGNEITCKITVVDWTMQMKDVNRSIYVYELSEFSRKLFEGESEEKEPEKEPEKGPEEEPEEVDNDGLPLLAYLAFKGMLSPYKIKRSNEESTQALSAVYNLQKVYDWYLDEFEWRGANGNGGKILVAVDFPKNENNASFGKLYKNVGMLTTGPDTSDLIEGEMCAYLEVIAHEFTHGRFAEFDHASRTNHEVGAINESYADIFGTFVEGRWNMAEGCFGGKPIRDFDTMVSNPGFTNETVCPLMYDEIDFKVVDPHVAGMLLTRCAMEMETSGTVTREENQKIWFKAITYGNINNSCTFRTMRENVEKAALDLGFGQEKADAIGEIFADHKIGDYPEKTVENGTEPGDEVLDDSVKHRYLTLWSPICTTLFGTPILVMEEKAGLDRSLSDSEISERLSQAMTEAARGRGMEDWIADHAGNIRYSRTGIGTINLIAKVFDAQKAKIGSAFSDGDGDEFVNTLISCEIYECTPYEFYAEVLGIDPQLLKH